LDGNSADEITRGFSSYKAPRRTNSSSTIGPNPAASTPSAEAAPSNLEASGDPAAGDTQESRISTKSGRTLWGASTAEGEGLASNERAPTLLLSGVHNAATAASAAQPAPGVLSQKQMQAPQQLNGGRMAMQGQQNADPPVLLVLLPMNGTFERKQITVPYFPDILRIGRQTNAKTVPTPVNGYFDSKVLSRQHAEVWADRSGKVWIRDVKSSNGTFVNGVRLSPESRDSEPHELRENDMLELGIDIVSEDQKSIVHHKVSAKIEHAGVQTNSSSVLDLNLGDIDPGSGGGLMAGLLPQGHMRGRSGSQGSMMSNGSRMSQSMNGNMNAMGVQRHMNAWLSPVSIEQVVKRLGVSSTNSAR
jgi:pSer/pThr/pTyr-binding forkhead associated (FHA) protein